MKSSLFKLFLLRKLFVLVFLTFGLSNANKIYVELLGPGLFGSLNYEREIISDYQVSARLGYGSMTIESEPSPTGNDDFGISINPLILGIHKSGGQKIKYELGFGISRWMFSSNNSNSVETDLFGLLIDNIDLTFYYASIGLKYEDPNGNWSFKIGFSPTITTEEFDNRILGLPHIGLGYRF